MLDKLHKNLEKAQQHVDALQQLIDSPYSNLEYRVSMIQRIKKIIKVMCERYQDGLTQRYGGNLTFISPKNITQLRKVMHATGLFGTHANIRDNVIVRPCRTGRSAGYFRAYSFNTVGSYLEFKNITREQVDTLHSTLELMGYPELVKILNTPVISGKDFSPTHGKTPSFAWQAVTDISSIDLKTYSDEQEITLHYLDFVLSQDATTVCVFDLEKLSTLYKRFISVFQKNYENYIFRDITNVQRMHRRYDFAYDCVVQAEKLLNIV